MKMKNNKVKEVAARCRKTARGKDPQVRRVKLLTEQGFPCKKVKILEELQCEDEVHSDFSVDKFKFPVNLASKSQLRHHSTTSSLLFCISYSLHSLVHLIIICLYCYS